MRVSLFGGGTDLPEFYLKHGGASLSFTIDKFVYIFLKSRFESNFRLSYSEIEEIENVGDIVHPIIKSVLELSNWNIPLEIASMADVPSRGSGLGSSSSFTVGLINALASFRREKSSTMDLAEKAFLVEREFCGVKVGKQDHYAAAFGGLNFFEFQPDNQTKISQISDQKSLLEDLFTSVMLFYTGVTRSAREILKAQAAVTEAGKNTRALLRTKELTYQAYKEFERGRTDFLGELLHQGWMTKKQFHDWISNSLIDQMYAKALAAGATGGKLLGAGGGGFLFLIAPPATQESVRNSLSNFREIKIQPSSNGSEVLYI